jgi:hypothetical protein
MARAAAIGVLLAALAGPGCIIYDDDDGPYYPPGQGQFDLYWQFASGGPCAPSEEVWVFFRPDYFGEPDKFNCLNPERQGAMSGLTGNLPLDTYEITVVLYESERPVQGVPPVQLVDRLVVDGQVKQHTIVFAD